MPDVPLPAADDVLARRLHAAGARLAARDDLDPDALARLRRQFIAVCDAAKQPGTGAAACTRRLDIFQAAFDAETARKSGYEN
jgi:hypothetical protein